nr:KrmJ [uncultured bacterium]
MALGIEWHMASAIHPPRLICGSEPRGQLGIGTYAMFVHEQLRLQDQYPGDTFVLIADYAALTHAQPASLVRQTAILGAIYLALGLDVRTSVIYRQSDVPQLFELFWLVAGLLPPQLAHGSPQAAHLPQNLAEELYPALMAADILGLRASIVNQFTISYERLDYACQIAKEINRRLDQDLFPIPRVVGNFPQPPVTHTSAQDLFAGPSVFGEASEFAFWLSALDHYGKTHHLVADMAAWFDAIATRLVDMDPLRQLQAACPEGHLLEDRLVRNELAALMVERLKPLHDTYLHLRSDPHIVEKAMQAGALRVRSELKETVGLLRETLGFSRRGDR